MSIVVVDYKGVLFSNIFLIRYYAKIFSFGYNIEKCSLRIFIPPKAHGDIFSCLTSLHITMYVNSSRK